MATKKTTVDNDLDAQAYVPSYKSVDRKGTWFFSKAQFPLLDPTHADKGNIARFEPQSYSQVEETDWVKSQHSAGVLVKYDRDPRDEGAEEVPYEAPPETKAAAPAPLPQGPATAPPPLPDSGRGQPPAPHAPVGQKR